MSRSSDGHCKANERDKSYGGDVSNVSKKRKKCDSKSEKEKKNRGSPCSPISQYDHSKHGLIEGGAGDYYQDQVVQMGEKQVCISMATDNLWKLHLKFYKYRMSIDSYIPKEEDEDRKVHEFIQCNELQDCKCVQKDVGIHHNVFPGFPNYSECNPQTNNSDKLHHYRLVVIPDLNFTTHRPTIICHDGKKFSFEGYSIFTHQSIEHIPAYFFLRNSMDHEVKFIKESFIPKGFCVHDLDLLSDLWFTDMFELLDWNHKETADGKCRKFHFMPRFICTERSTQKTSPQLLSMAAVLEHLMESYKPFLQQTEDFHTEQVKKYSRENYGSLVINPKKKPKTIRVDGITMKENNLPMIEHSTMFAATSKDSTVFSDLCDQLHKAKQAVNNRAVPREQDKQLVSTLQDKIDKLKNESCWKNSTDVHVSCEGFMSTGLRWDICQHASYLPGVWRYLSYMLCIPSLEEKLNYTFKDKYMLKTALTHPSYTDQSALTTHTRTMLQNVGKRVPHVRQKSRPASLGYRKKGVINMTTIMANFHTSAEHKPLYQNNERLEFLGDAVLDYITSFHLFLMFPEKGPGKLTMFRSALVQKDNLVRISKKLELEKYILLHHNMNENRKMENLLANAVEAIIGAVYLDGGLTYTDEFLSTLLFSDDDELATVWGNLRKHPLQNLLPSGDRHLISTSATLQKLTKLEERIGIQFQHIRILAKALTQSVSGLDDPTLTGGNYERLEFLGDAILKYVCTDHLYRRFQIHQEGHLTLLRTTFVNTECLSKAAKEIDLNEYIVYKSKRDAAAMSEKVVCDVFEAFVGAIHIDKGIKHCRKFIEVCILSRLEEFVMNQDWIDPKTQLQQCCHSLRNTLVEAESSSHLPVYKKLEHTSERGTQLFKVAVYFQDQRLGTGTGPSLKSAEKEAARDALRNNHFEQHARQKRIAYKKFGPKTRTEESHAMNATDRRNSHDERRRDSSREGRHHSSTRTHHEYLSDSSGRKRATSTSSNASSPKRRRNHDARSSSSHSQTSSPRRSTKRSNKGDELLSSSDNRCDINLHCAEMSDFEDGEVK